MMYASNGLIVAVVMLCLVVPVGAGFLMPNNESIDTWQTDIVPLDLTPELAVTDVPNTSPYNGVNNNLFLLNDDNGYVTKGLSEVDYATTYGNYHYSTYGWDIEYYVPDGTNTYTGTQIWNALKQYQPNAEPGMMVIHGGYNAGDQYEIAYDGQSYDYMIIFSNQRVQLFDTTTHHMVDATGESFTLTKSGQCLVMYYYTNWMTLPRFIDPAGGFEYSYSTDGVCTWSNGYINHNIRMIFKVSEGTQFSINIGDQNLKVGIGLLGNTIRVGYQYGSQPSVGDSLGSRNVYNYVLMYLDSDENIIQFTGLMGMANFTDSYVDKIGNTVSWDAQVEPFNSMSFAQGTIQYYVASTTIENGTVKAIKDASVIPDDYNSATQWQLVIANPTVFGDSLTLGNTTYDVARGYVTLPLYDEETQSYEDKRVAVRDMKITRVLMGSTPNILINGDRLDPGVETDISGISFGGVWLTSVYLYEVEWTHKTNYFWEEGGFNLDLTGYCVVGMVVSALCFIAAALMRSPGWADEIAMGLAVVFGIIYFAVMITG